MYRFWFCIKFIISRHFKKFGKLLNTRLQSRIRHTLTFSNNAKFISYERKSKEIIAKFLWDRLATIQRQELFIEFGKEVYEFHQEFNDKIAPGNTNPASKLK